jgi:ABC-2 type transport system permease protein
VSLARAEVRRLTKRRFTRWLVIGTLVLLALIAGGTFLSNEAVGPAQLAEARAEADRQYQQATVSAQAEMQRCLAAPGTADAGNYPSDCSQMYQPTPEDFRPEYYMASTFTFKEKFGDVLGAFVAIFALMGFVIGASYVGAEWTSGGMMNLLLWRPKRLQVLGTKLGVLLASMAALSVVGVAAWTGIFLLIAKLRGNTEGMTSGTWQSIALTELRGLVVILVATAIGFGLASIGRHTALALGVAAGVVVILQFGLYLVLSLAKVPFAEAVLLPIWAIAWMEKEVELENFNSCDFSATQGCQPETLTLTWPAAGGLLTILFVLVVGAALWTMRSRDVA